MLYRVLILAFVIVMVGSVSAQPNPTAQQKEVIEWVLRSIVDQQRYDWSDWSAEDRRVVLVADETIPFPQLAADDYSLTYAVESLNAERSDLYAQLRNATIVGLGAWRPAPPASCGEQDDEFPQVNVVPARTLEPAFRGEGLDGSVALVVRVSAPAFSTDGRAAAVYAEAVGSHVENSYKELISLTQKSNRPGEWDAMITRGSLFSPAKPSAQERVISAVDRAVMTAALQWLVTKRGEFDLVSLADFSPDPAEGRRRLRQLEPSLEVPEATLAQLFRRNGEELVFDTSIFSVKGVRNLAADDIRIWSQPSVLISLPAYDGDVAILSVTYRTSDDIPQTASYLVLLLRSEGAWSVVSAPVQEGVIVS